MHLGERGSNSGVFCIVGDRVGKHARGEPLPGIYSCLEPV